MQQTYKADNVFREKNSGRIMANDDEHCYLFSQSTLKLVVLLGAQKNHLNEMVL